MRMQIAALTAALMLSGCAGSSKVMVGQARPPIDPSQVRIYTSVPPGSQEIAQIESSSAIGFGTQGQTDSAVTRLKTEAAALGANGVVLMRPDADSPFTATTFETATGETPLLSNVLPAGDAGFLVIGDKGADMYRPQ